MQQIILSGYTPYPKTTNDPRLPHIADKLTSQIHKTALGAENMVPFTYYESLDEWLSLNNTAKKLPIIGLEQSDRSVMLPDFIPPDEFALLLGEEVRGIETQRLTKCEHLIEIPMRGQKESFNVSVAAGIALYGLNFK